MTDWLAPLMPHLLIVPILLPMLIAAGMLLLGERFVSTKGLIGMVSCLLNLAVAIALLVAARGIPGPLDEIRRMPQEAVAAHLHGFALAGLQAIGQAHGRHPPAAG